MSTMWRTVRLREVLIERRETPDAEALAIGSIRIVSKIGFERGRVELRQELGTQTGMILVRPGDLLLSGINAAKGAIAIYGAENSDPVAATIHYGAYSVVPEHADITYLWWYLRSNAFRESLSRSLPEGIKTELRSKRLLSLEIPLPSLAEQRRIVARIEALAAQIAEARSLRDQAAEEAEALSSAGRKPFFAVAARGFGVSRLDELTSRVTKGESPEWQGFTYQEDGPLFIRSENVLWGTIDPRSAVHIPTAFHEKLSRSQLRPGDVLINLVGASIGRACAVPSRLGAANVNQAVCVVSPDSSKLLSEYLVHFLLSPVAQDVIHGVKVETARPNISLVDVRDLEVPVPPLPEQRRIVAYLDGLQAQVEALKRLQAETAAKLDALLPSVLDRAFKGEL